MPFFLLGHMGCGKTTIGKKTANKLNIPFIDLDELIEEKQGMSINDIFSTKGESFFRKLESSMLHTYPFQKDTIVASGGGTPCFYDNYNFMKSTGVTIYLKVSVSEIIRRIQFNYTRPLLWNNNLNLHDFIHQSLSEREAVYMKSDYVIESDNISEDDIQKIVKI